MITSCGRRIILSAGIVSSNILERSGIGNGTLLSQLGIPVLYNNNNVGEHMVTHIGPVMVIGTSNTTLVNSDPQAMINQFLEGVSFVPLSTAPTIPRKVQINAASRNTLNPRVSTTFNITSTQNPITIFAWDLNPQSTGFIHITSPSLFHPPDIQFNFFGTPQDRANTTAIYRLLFDIFRRLQSQNPSQDFQLLFPPPAVFESGTDRDILTFAELSVSITDHYSSTNRMNPNPNLGVVDAELRVHGTENLYIADVSISPIITDANTAHIAYVIGFKLAQILTEED